MRGVPKSIKDPEVQRFLEELLKEVTERDKDKLYQSRANHSLLLLSPSLKTYEVRVDDAGALSVTLVQG